VGLGSKLLGLFKRNPKIPVCPKCGGALFYPQIVDVAPLLGSYSPVFIICENHKDAESFCVIGNKSCDYDLGLSKSRPRALVVMPKDMKIGKDDLIGVIYNLGSTFTIEPARLHPEIIGRVLWEFNESTITSDFHPYLAFRWYGEK